MVARLGASPWSDKELAFLKANSKKMTQKDMAKHLQRSLSSVRSKISALGFNRKKNPWTKAEIKYLTDNAGKMEADVIASELGRDLVKTKFKINSLGLSYMTKPSKCWTHEQLDLLEELAGYRTIEDLSEILDKPLKAVKVRARALGLSLCTVEGIELNRLAREAENKSCNMKMINRITGLVDSNNKNVINIELLASLPVSRVLALHSAWSTNVQ